MRGFSAIIGALVGTLTTLATLYFGQFITERYRRRSRRIEIALERCNNQIGQLYAPLSILIEQLTVISKIKDNLVEADSKHAAEINKLAYHTYFLPIHEKITKILESNLHLIEDEYVPDSFCDYYKHVASERVFFSLVDAMQQAKQDGRLSEEAAHIDFKPFPFPEKKNETDNGMIFQLISKQDLTKFLQGKMSF